MAQPAPSTARGFPAPLRAALVLVALVLLGHWWTLQAIALRMGRLAQPSPPSEILHPLLTRTVVVPTPTPARAPASGAAPDVPSARAQAAPAPVAPSPSAPATATPAASIALATSDAATAAAPATHLSEQASPPASSLAPVPPPPQAPEPAANPPPSPSPVPAPVAASPSPGPNEPAPSAPTLAALADQPAPPNPTPEPAPQPAPAAAPLPEPAVAATATSTATAPAAAALAPPPRPLVWPASMGLAYQLEINAFPLPARAELRWRHDGAHYEASLSLLSLLSIVRTSKGAITPQGLEPLRYGEKITARGETAVHFQRDKGVVSFSNNKPSVALLPGVQDELSVFFQIAALLGGDPRQAAPGNEIPVQTVESRAARKLVFVVGAGQTLDLPGGRTHTVYLSHSEPPNYEGSRASKGELWLAPGMDYVPVRIRITEPSGTMYDLRWSQTLPP